MVFTSSTIWATLHFSCAETKTKETPMPACGIVQATFALTSRILPAIVSLSCIVVPIGRGYTVSM